MLPAGYHAFGLKSGATRVYFRLAPNETLGACSVTTQKDRNQHAFDVEPGSRVRIERTTPLVEGERVVVDDLTVPETHRPMKCRDATAGMLAGCACGKAEFMHDCGVLICPTCDSASHQECGMMAGNCVTCGRQWTEEELETSWDIHE